MPVMFNSVLRETGLRPEDVRLLRHQDNESSKGRTPYALWRDNLPQFELYQSTQGIGNCAKLKATYWASFVGTPSGETMFVGLYRVGDHRLMEQDTPMAQGGGVDKAGTCHIYELQLEQKLNDLAGRLFIEWGLGKRSWIQRADLQDKVITCLLAEFTEPEFPGFLNFVEPLSRMDALPPSWKAALRSAKGVYLLTCPRTKEQYVGSATGEEAFWGRWQEYVRDGHGGNVGLKSREPSDYQVSILEVAGSASTSLEIVAMEQKWKRKLQSMEMGLNRN